MLFTTESCDFNRGRFKVGPPTTAYLITDNLTKMLILSPIFGILSALSGYWLAIYFDVTIAGTMATMVGIIFALIFIFIPDKGLIANIRRRKEQKYEFALISLLMHLINHENSPIEREEAGVDTIKDHLSWDKGFTQEIIDKTLDKNYVYIKDEILKITEKGRKFALSNYSHIIMED